jgi:hypothetical protein
MKTITTAAAIIALTCAAAFAQVSAQQDKGLTGWHGASRVPSETTGKAASPGNPANMTVSNGPLGPEMATGLDLKGPPKRFPNNKTPE